MSDLDQARTALQRYALMIGPGFIDRVERFEAAVRANERSGETRAAVLREAAVMVRGYDTDPSTQGAADELDRMATGAQP